VVPSDAGSGSRIPCARAFIDVRWFIAVRWIQRKASASVMPCSAISRPLACSTILRVSSRSSSVRTSPSRAAISVNRARATSIAGTRSFFENGLTR